MPRCASSLRSPWRRALSACLRERAWCTPRSRLALGASHRAHGTRPHPRGRGEYQVLARVPSVYLPCTRSYILTRQRLFVFRIPPFRFGLSLDNVCHFINHYCKEQEGVFFTSLRLGPAATVLYVRHGSRAVAPAHANAPRHPHRAPRRRTRQQCTGQAVYVRVRKHTRRPPLVLPFTVAPHPVSFFPSRL